MDKVKASFLGALQSKVQEKVKVIEKKIDDLIVPGQVFQKLIKCSDPKRGMYKAFLVP